MKPGEARLGWWRFGMRQAIGFLVIMVSVRGREVVDVEQAR
jgi:hypothetical protein